MKLRTVTAILTPLTGHSEADMLAHANTYGYLLPGGGTPWDAETMTIRLLGRGPVTLDVTARFDPDKTFEPPASPAARKPYTVRYRYPAPPALPGQSATFAEVEAGWRRGRVEIEMCEGYVWRAYGLDAGHGARVDTSEALTDTVSLLETAERMAEALGQHLSRG